MGKLQDLHPDRRGEQERLARVVLKVIKQLQMEATRLASVSYKRDLREPRRNVCRFSNMRRSMAFFSFASTVCARCVLVALPGFCD
jgi:hypothetical protein